MSTLPQHKKSPEELARLRESLGVPVAPPLDPEASPPPATPAGPPPHAHPGHHPRLHQPAKRPAPDEPDPVTRSVGTEPVTHLDVAEHEPPAAQHEPKPVRSLKRSERLAPATQPTQPHAPVDAGKLPVHRHSDRELAEIRRRSAVAAIAEGGFEFPQVAAKPLLGLAYLLSLGGALAPTALSLLGKLTDSYNTGKAFGEGYHLLVAGCLAALPFAGFIAVRRTPSRHHAAFVAIIAFFALVFAVLHYFPFLKHGT